MKLRATIDTNVIVSGALFGGIPLEVLHAAFNDKFIWVISSPLIDELRAVLGSKKFQLSKDEAESLIGPILEICEIVVPVETVDVIPRCPKDNRVIECAHEGRCEYLVTGDRRDLLALKSFRRISIVTARDFLKILSP